MKNSNITKNRTRVALLLVLVASVIGLAPAFSTSARAGTYSVFSVQGNYVDLGERWDLSSGSVNTSSPNFLPGSVVGLITFTPATSTFHADWIVRTEEENGEAIHDGTYTVDATGHGTMIWGGAVGPKRRDFYIVNGGAELKYINTDPPSTFTASVIGTMTKQ